MSVYVTQAEMLHSHSYCCMLAASRTLLHKGLGKCKMALLLPCGSLSPPVCSVAGCIGRLDQSELTPCRALGVARAAAAGYRLQGVSARPLHNPRGQPSPTMPLPPMADTKVDRGTQTLSSSRSSTGSLQEVDGRSSSSSSTREERNSCQGAGQTQMAVVGSLFWGAAQ